MRAEHDKTHVCRHRARAVQKKNDNFTKGNRRAQGCVDISPAGRARDPARCPHAPVTLHCNTCGGCRDALPGHYLCCDGADRRVCRSSHRMMYSPSRTVGGSSLPSGLERILGQGHFHPPTCAGATIRAQKVDKSKTIHFDKMCTGHSGTSLPMGHPGQAGTVLTDRRQNILTMKVQAKRHEPLPGASGSGRFHAVGVEKHQGIGMG